MEDMYLDDNYLDFNLLYGIAFNDEIQNEKTYKCPKSEPQSTIIQSHYKKQFQSRNFQGNKNNKNKYINKISEMAKIGTISDPGTKSQKSRKINRSHATMSSIQKQYNDQDSLEGRSSQKLQRNRLSAKQSRQRKKLYIDLLEKQIVKLQQQKNELEQQIKINKSNINKYISQNQVLNGLNIGKQTYIKKLQKIIQNKQQSQNEEINIILDSLSMRIGATGKTRINLVNQYFKQILNLGFPVLYRYMLWSASQSKHAFTQNIDVEQWFNSQQFNMNTQQTKQMIKVRQTLIGYKYTFSQLLNKLMQLKRKLYQKQQALQIEMDTLRNILTPIQCAQFIIFIEKYKYKQEMNIEYSKQKRSHNDLKKQEIDGNQIKKQQIIQEIVKKTKIQ